MTSIVRQIQSNNWGKVENKFKRKNNFAMLQQL